jgi:hypothetical protein
MAVRISRSALEAAILPIEISIQNREGDDFQLDVKVTEGIPITDQLLAIEEEGEYVEFPDAHPGDLAVRSEDTFIAIPLNEIRGLRGLVPVMSEPDAPRTVSMSPLGLNDAREILKTIEETTPDAMTLIWFDVIDQWQATLLAHVEDLDPAMRDGIFISAASAQQGAKESLPDGISVEDLQRGVAYINMKRQITSLEPGHPDGYPAPALMTVAEKAGVPHVRTMSGTYIPENFRGFVRKVFGTMTKTPIEKVMATIVNAGSVEQLETYLTGNGRNLADDNWMDGVRTSLGEVLDKFMPGYKNSVETAFYAEDGTDILVVRDHHSKARDSAYIYTWPSTDRNLILDAKEMEFFITEAEIPTEEEFYRVQDVLDRLRDEYGAEEEEEDEYDGPRIR